MNVHDLMTWLNGEKIQGYQRVQDVGSGLTAYASQARKPSPISVLADEAHTEVVVEIDGETFPVKSICLRATGDWGPNETPAVLVIRADKHEPAPIDEPVQGFIPDNVKAYTKRGSQD